MIFHGILNFPDFFCISWPVFLPYISFAIHDLDFSMLVIMCIYIYLFIYLFKVWLLYRWFLFPYVLSCVWALHPKQSPLIFGHWMSRPVRWKWQYLKGKDSIGRYSHFWLNHDYGRKATGYHVFFLFGCLRVLIHQVSWGISHHQALSLRGCQRLRSQNCQICRSDPCVCYTKALDNFQAAWSQAKKTWCCWIAQVVLLDPSREKQGDEKRDSEKRHQMWHETTHKNMEKLLGTQKKDINQEREEGDKTQSDLGSDWDFPRSLYPFSWHLEVTETFFMWLLGGFPR